MIENSILREAPQVYGTSACQPDVIDEPVLNIRNIQGNIIAGFNKDFQIILLLEIADASVFKEWLGSLIPFVATAHEVLWFNRLYKEVGSRRGESRALSSTWMNLAISFKGLKKLVPGEEVEQFRDESFRLGLQRRSSELGDPVQGPGSPETWVVGGARNDADVILIFAADNEGDILVEVDRIEKSILKVRADGSLNAGVQVIYKQRGAVLPSPRKGHEHFGFLDGVSQPGLRGRASADPHDVITLRQNPEDPNQGKPGQDLLWPGEFVFGYPCQDSDDVTKKGPDSLRPDGQFVAPEWARDGSYLVFRRLRQDVEGFNAFLTKAADELSLPIELLSGKVVGRFPSGAPIMRTQADDPKLGGDDCANNDFEFSSEDDKRDSGETLTANFDDCQCKLLAKPEPDDEGLVCPYAAHIRKTYPRNDSNRFPGQTGEASNQKHRLIRRGIPFGPPYPVEPPPGDCDLAERGLLFLAYQTSIVNQFEHVQRVFANNPEKGEKTGEVLAGYDLIIGQNRDGDRPFVVPVRRDGCIERLVVRAERQWVLPTGGGYFFAPSIEALNRIARIGEKATT